MTQINIDKLRLCFLQPENLIQNILERADNNGFVDYGDFLLYMKDVEREEETVRHITADLFLLGVVENQERTFLGTFVFHNTARYEGKCFFSFDNQALYTSSGVVNGEKNNLTCYLAYVQNQLGLRFNNITELEVACDASVNVIGKIRQYIRNYDQYEMFLNGRIVHDHTKRIRGYCEIFGRSRRRLNRLPSLYVKQSGIGVPFHLKVYNKSVEMNDESPEKRSYISRWNDFGERRNIYRIEVTLGNPDFREWQNNLRSAVCPYPKEWSDPTNTLNLLMLEDYRWALWFYCCKRLLFFRNREDRSEVTLLDIVEGNAH